MQTETAFKPYNSEFLLTLRFPWEQQPVKKSLGRSFVFTRNQTPAKSVFLGRPCQEMSI